MPKTEKRRRKNVKTLVATSSSTSTPAAASAPNDKLFAKLDRYEDMLKSLGVDVEAIEIPKTPHSRATLDCPRRHAVAPDEVPLNGRPEPGQDMVDKSLNSRLVSYAKRCPYAEGASMGKMSRNGNVRCTASLSVSKDHARALTTT
jgi:hypothetical protein